MIDLVDVFNYTIKYLIVVSKRKVKTKYHIYQRRPRDGVIKIRNMQKHLQISPTIYSIRSFRLNHLRRKAYRFKATKKNVVEKGRGWKRSVINFVLAKNVPQNIWRAKDRSRFRLINSSLLTIRVTFLNSLVLEPCGKVFLTSGTKTRDLPT